MASSSTAYPTYPTARYAGSNSERQSIGLPGHCERCAELGHVRAHSNFGCGDVGCDSAHGPAEEAAARVEEDQRGRRAALGFLFSAEDYTEQDEADANQILTDLHKTRHVLAGERRQQKASFPTSLVNRLVVVLTDGSPTGDGPMTEVAGSQLSEAHQLLLVDEGTDVDVVALADVLVADVTNPSRQTALLVAGANAAGVPVVLVGRGAAHLLSELNDDAAEVAGYGSTETLVSYLSDAVVRLARR